MSVPLAVAVAGEKVAHYPRIVLDRRTGVEARAHSMMLNGTSFFMPCDDGLYMVQPFHPDYPPPRNFTNIDRYEEHLEPLVAKYAKTPHAAKWTWMHSVLKDVREHFENLASIEADNNRDDIRD